MAGTGLAARLTSAIIWALMTAVFAVMFALQDVLRVDDPAARTFSGTSILGACHALGGAAAGYLLAGLFGRAGLAGWPLAVLGTLVTVLLGGLLGGLALAVYGTMTETANLSTDLIRIGLGAVTAPLAIADSPWLAPLWAAVGAAAHLTCRGLRG